MKRIGILTFYQSDNVGAVLQAYALCRTINNGLGLCEIIKYTDRKKREKKMGRLKCVMHNLWYTSIKRKLFKDPKWIKTISFIEQYDILSNQEYRSSCELNENPPDYDIYITGSDQVWNPNITGDDDSYFLTFAPPQRTKISYGASIGSITFLEKHKKQYKYLISNLDAVSLRENDAAKAVSDLIGREVECVLDPTLLLNSKEWSCVENKPNGFSEGKYILCYYMPGDRIVEEGIKRIAKCLSQRYKLPVYNLGLKDINRVYLNKNNIFNAGPAEFIWLIKNAECVITNSFHGAAFSINFNRDLYVPINVTTDPQKTKASRLLSILNMLDMNDRIVSCTHGMEDSEYISQLKKEKYDYSRANGLLEKQRMKSKEFLRDAINK